MQAIIDRKWYDTESATLVASDRYWDGSNHDRGGRNTYLYRTPRGSFFQLHTTRWQGERDRIEPLTGEQAMDAYESLPERELSWEEAFVEEPDEA